MKEYEMLMSDDDVAWDYSVHFTTDDICYAWWSTWMGVRNWFWSWFCGCYSHI